MKALFKYAIILVSLSSLLFLTSCELDEDDPDGLEDARAKFSGSWMCTEQHNQFTYPVTITKSSNNSSEVLIKNFNFFGESEYAIAKIAGFSMNIPEQEVCNTKISGNGQMSANKRDIVLQYTVKDGAHIETINANYTKQ